MKTPQQERKTKMKKLIAPTLLLAFTLTACGETTQQTQLQQEEQETLHNVTQILNEQTPKPLEEQTVAHITYLLCDTDTSDGIDLGTHLSLEEALSKDPSFAQNKEQTPQEMGQTKEILIQNQQLICKGA